MDKLSNKFNLFIRSFKFIETYSPQKPTIYIEKKVTSDNGDKSPQYLSVTSIDGMEFSHTPHIDDFIFTSTVWKMATENECTVVASETSHVWKLLQSESQKSVRASLDLKKFSDYVEKAHQQKRSDQQSSLNAN